MRKILFFILLLVACVEVKSQSDFDMSQRWLNQRLYNPGAIGNSLTSTVYTQARMQWVGLDGAPTTAVVGGNLFLNDIQSSIGVNVDYDKIGFTGTYNFRASYSYYIPLYNSALSFGLSAALLHRNQNANGALIDDPTDPELLYGNFTETKPDFDFGIEYNGPFRLGISVRHLIGVGTSKSFEKYTTNVWMYASTRLNLNKDVTFSPLISYASRDNFNRYEIGALFYFNRTYDRLNFSDKSWVGLVYRLNSQFSLLAGTYLTPRMRIGYSFDYAHGDLAGISKAGTHEIFISYQFKSKSDIHGTTICPLFKRAKQLDEAPMSEMY